MLLLLLLPLVIVLPLVLVLELLLLFSRTEFGLCCFKMLGLEEMSTNVSTVGKFESHSSSSSAHSCKMRRNGELTRV